MKPYSVKSATVIGFLATLAFSSVKATFDDEGELQSFDGSPMVGGPLGGIGGLKIGHIGPLRYAGLNKIKLRPSLFGGSLLGAGNPHEQGDQFDDIPNDMAPFVGAPHSQHYYGVQGFEDDMPEDARTFKKKKKKKHYHHHHTYQQFHIHVPHHGHHEHGYGHHGGYGGGGGHGGGHGGYYVHHGGYGGGGGHGGGHGGYAGGGGHHSGGHGGGHGGHGGGKGHTNAYYRTFEDSEDFQEGDQIVGAPTFDVYPSQLLDHRAAPTVSSPFLSIMSRPFLGLLSKEDLPTHQWYSQFHNSPNHNLYDV
ncbi:hypothetical protein DMENIID0001_127360 [Sergentomyia squamirostris]